jgi:hypothetical protein
MKLKAFIQTLEPFAPPERAEERNPTGLRIEPPKAHEIKKARPACRPGVPILISKAASAPLRTI